MKDWVDVDLDRELARIERESYLFLHLGNTQRDWSRINFEQMGTVSLR